MTPFIETHLGIRFQPLKPVVNDIHIEDIAHHLSHQCRFLGSTSEFYSVAEHSVRVSYLIQDWGGDYISQLEGLLHDASEAYLTDFPTPLKCHWWFGFFYRRAERRLQRAVAQKFGLADEQPQIVHMADARMLATEVRDLKVGDPGHWRNLKLPVEDPIIPWSSLKAKRTFLTVFHELTRGYVDG